MKLVPIFLLFTSLIFAQTKSYYYPVETSLNDHRITAIEQDAFGRLILGTDIGVFSFNGFQSKQIASLKLYSKDIIQLLKLKDKFLGLNKTGQLFEIKNEEIVLITLQNLKSQILRLEKTKDGNLRILSLMLFMFTKRIRFHCFLKQKFPFMKKENRN